MIPDNEQILRDYRKCGGDVDELLKLYAKKDDERGAIAIEILEQITADGKAHERWDHIGVVAEQAAALRARAELIRLSKSKGPGQIQALKLVRDFTKDHKGKVREAIDSHLDGLEEDETDA